MNSKIEKCVRCPRLRDHCLSIAREKKKAFADEKYWGLPVPDFGADDARLLIVGLAPAAHGANRTGRMFTGDRSGEWLYQALFDHGFASKPVSVHSSDDLQLIDCRITAVAHCAPPDNKPTREEIENCRSYLDQCLTATPFQVVLVLGQIAFTEVYRYLRDRDLLSVDTTAKNLPRTAVGPRGSTRKVSAIPKFSHGGELTLRDGRRVLMSYHPSQQNTFTGRLTKPMWNSVFARARALLI